MKIVLKGLPIPPSVNQMLAPVRGRLIKTSIGRDYEKRCQLFALTHSKEIEGMAALARSWVENGSTVRVDVYFIFKKERIFSKKNEPKKLDVDNRLKPCLDQLSNMLKIDDKYFFAGWREKLWTLSLEKEQTLIVLKKHSTRQDLLLNLSQDKP
jgi:Holliday junction resolvase RusA-like endonuclease